MCTRVESERVLVPFLLNDERKEASVVESQSESNCCFVRPYISVPSLATFERATWEPPARVPPHPQGSVSDVYIAPGLEQTHEQAEHIISEPPLGRHSFAGMAYAILISYAPPPRRHSPLGGRIAPRFLPHKITWRPTPL